MERIKQAIERARVERHSRGANQDAVRRGSPRAQEDSPQESASSWLPARSVEVHWPSLYERRVVGGSDANAHVDAYRVLRTHVLQRMNKLEARTLGVTSPNPGEGKSLTSVNLAISLAKQRPVLLIDVDLRRPSIHWYLGVEPSAGLSECLLGEASVEECLVNLSIEGLTVLPGGATTANSSELLASSKMLELLGSLKQLYPEILFIFDLPPVLSADDTLVFSSNIDVALLVVEEGRTTPMELSRAADLLHSTQLLGTILNKSTDAQQVYYYRPHSSSA